MSAPLRAFLAALLAGSAALPALPALADSNQAPAPAAMVTEGEHARLQACPQGSGPRLDLVQGMPTDCCKGHKGICGCRAGKIVCCDGTVSKVPNCTCHSDWGLAN